MSAALTVKDLNVSYGDIHAVKGISFEVQRGEIFTLIGANGAGKSSALRAISGLLRYQGSVTFDDHELNGVAAEKIVTLGLAQVPEGRGIFGNLTVLENLKLGAWIRNDRKAIAEDMERVLDKFPRLRERVEQLAGTMSGGEQQMLSVARALMSRATMLLLDEPSMGLAPKLVKEIYGVLREINKTGVTILLVEQNANLALKLADRAAVLETGIITIAGSSVEVLQNPRVREAYLGA
jgi:branched-chain amino acid transport system ATP-binding protein